MTLLQFTYTYISKRHNNDKSQYPDENTYSSFLNEHGGSSNAYTDFEHTNYYFDVAHDSLTEVCE